MKKRTFLRLSLIALLGTAGFVAFLLTRPGSPINRRNFEKIQVGMTLAEVEAIIGLPAGVTRPCGATSPQSACT